MAFATRADDLGGFTQARAQALTRHFEQAETRDATDLDAGTVRLEGVLEALFHLALVARAVHVDEVDDDQAAGIAGAQRAGDLPCGLVVGGVRRFLDVAVL